jgi:hypothetical protein
MCTVTFIPAGTGFFLTSNRDESKSRGSAVPPRIYREGVVDLIYPRDADAGGSWIAMKEEGSAGVLLNGAFHKHLRKPPYRASRGVILIAVMGSAEPLQQFRGMDLTEIEPFTLVLLVGSKLWDCRWDGTRKHIVAINSKRPHIWSSATLYDERTAKERTRWFERWYQERDRIDAEDVVTFHKTAGDGDVRNSLVMNRDNKHSTVSVTTIVRKKGQASMMYYDLRTGDYARAGFEGSRIINKQDGGSPKKLMPAKLKWWCREFLIRLSHWEYWPTHLIYGPIYPVWLWFSFRARSFFFFNAANPQIEYAGFTHERKSEIYRQMPSRFYPRTHLCRAGMYWPLLRNQLKRHAFVFPLIAKPDIGEKGTQVSLLNTDSELENYCRRSLVNFLVQDYIPYDLEVGIFYVRIPGEQNGKITGVVGKEFLTIKGDGFSTVRELLQRTPRFLLQLSALEQKNENIFDEVLKIGESRTLAPYGNHARGAKFVDWSNMITEELTTVIDNISKQIPGFYFGRMDIKCSSWEELTRGERFSIIELNGAGSEPTHIYDPRHTLFFAWKEIIRHWRLLFRVSLINARENDIPLMSTLDGLRMLKKHRQYMKLTQKL